MKQLMPLISFVIPCFNEQEVIVSTIHEIINYTNQKNNYQFEIIFVDDGSIDNTSTLILGKMSLFPIIKLIKFSRNFGQQIATTAGIDYATGDSIILLDADLQDPLLVVDQMIQKWEEGYDVVYGTRTYRYGESLFKRISSKIFYRLLNTISDIPIPNDTGDFRLLSRQASDALRNMPERDRFLRGMISWIGFKQISIPYKRPNRILGNTKYSFIKMLNLAAVGMISFSNKPLQLSIYVGFISSGISLLGIIFTIVIRFMTSNWIAGWTSLMLVTLFIGGIQLIGIGILGEYVGRIYLEIKKRPLYLIQETHGLEKFKTDNWKVEKN